MILNSLCDPYARKILYTRTLCCKYCCYKIGNVLTVMPSHVRVEDYRLLDSLVCFIPKPDCACIEKRAQRAQENTSIRASTFSRPVRISSDQFAKHCFFQKEKCTEYTACSIGLICVDGVEGLHKNKTQHSEIDER